jgi:spermidine/putrescine transport system ATP-binding protein
MSFKMHGQEIELIGCSMRFNEFTAVQPTDLTIRAGEFFSILGPSGCGKTTILRMISGFLTPTTGDVLIGGQSMLGIRPNDRPTALIFQNLALFPLMQVWENVAFGLEARGVGKKQRRERAMELLRMVALEQHADKTPGQLSGGQRQRVAIARALAVEPAVLLLDEPLSALDLKLRQHMRAELKDIQRKTGVTFVYITHDQGEALTMSDRVAVMNQGVIEQIGTTDEIYSAPASPFVATFVGEQNVLAGKVVAADQRSAQLETALGRLKGINRHGLSAGDDAILLVRPERVQVIRGKRTKGPENSFDAQIERRDLEGPFVNLYARAGAQQVQLHLTNDASLAVETGMTSKIGFSAADAVVMRAGELASE